MTRMQAGRQSDTPPSLPLLFASSTAFVHRHCTLHTQHLPTSHSFPILVSLCSLCTACGCFHLASPPPATPAGSCCFLAALALKAQKQASALSHVLFLLLHAKSPCNLSSRLSFGERGSTAQFRLPMRFLAAEEEDNTVRARSQRCHYYMTGCPSSSSRRSCSLCSTNA